MPCHALADALEDGETAEKERPDQPAGDSQITDNDTRQRKAMSFERRVCFDSGKRDVSADNSGYATRHKKAAAKPEQTENAEDQRQDGELFCLARRNYRRRRHNGGRGW